MSCDTTTAAARPAVGWRRGVAAGGMVVVMLGCSRQRPAATPDSSFAAMQQRGRAVMGVDQYTSTHHFDDSPDGGRIVLERDSSADTAGIRAIRDHLRHEADRFAAGDFTDPAAVHGQTVPGSDVLSARRARIRYDFQELPRGGELRITTTDTAAIRAVHEFLAFQRGAHHAGGHAMPGMRMP